MRDVSRRWTPSSGRRRNLRGVARKNKDEDAEPKKKSKIRTLFKWATRISIVAGIVSAVRKYQVDQNEAKSPPAA